MALGRRALGGSHDERFTAAILRISRQANGDQDGKTDNHPKKIRRYADQIKAVLEHGEKENGKHNAANGPNATNQTGAPQNSDSEHIQLLPGHSCRNGLVDTPCLDESGDGCKKPEIAVGKQLNPKHADANSTCGLRIAAKRVDFVVPSASKP